MKSNPTKILLYDLDASLQKVFNELNIVQGSFDTIDERLNNIDVDMLGVNEKEILQDLISAYNNDNKGITGERLRNIENELFEIKNTVGSISLDELEIGNYSEEFEYDTDGNVIGHKSTGDRQFVVTYNYKSDGSGELDTSVKEFLDNNNKNVTITKEYVYTNGDITGINTKTEII